MRDRDQPARIAACLRTLRSGVVDTSTLIYLERLQMIEQAACCFTLFVIPQVAGEYGTALPASAVPVASAPAGPADRALWQTARQLGQPVLSEDRKVLGAARAARLPYYNTLMLLLSLLARGHLTPAEYGDRHGRLLGFARYSLRVVAVGEAVLREMAPSLQEQAVRITERAPAPAPAPRP